MGTGIDGKNTVPELMRFFGTEDRPCRPAEFREFWDACSEEEREQYRKADISEK